MATCISSRSPSQSVAAAGPGGPQSSAGLVFPPELFADSRAWMQHRSNSPTPRCLTTAGSPPPAAPFSTRQHELICPIPSVNWREAAREVKEQCMLASEICPIPAQNWRSSSLPPDATGGNLNATGGGKMSAKVRSNSGDATSLLGGAAPVQKVKSKPRGKSLLGDQRKTDSGSTPACAKPTPTLQSKSGEEKDQKHHAPFDCQAVFRSVTAPGSNTNAYVAMPSLVILPQRAAPPQSPLSSPSSTRSSGSSLFSLAPSSFSSSRGDYTPSNSRCSTLMDGAIIGDQHDATAQEFPFHGYYPSSCYVKDTIEERDSVDLADRLDDADSPRLVIPRGASERPALAAPLTTDLENKRVQAAVKDLQSLVSALRTGQRGGQATVVASKAAAAEVLAAVKSHLTHKEPMQLMQQQQPQQHYALYEHKLEHGGAADCQEDGDGDGEEEGEEEGEGEGEEVTCINWQDITELCERMDIAGVSLESIDIQTVNTDKQQKQMQRLQTPLAARTSAAAAGAPQRKRTVSMVEPVFPDVDSLEAEASLPLAAVAASSAGPATAADSKCDSTLFAMKFRDMRMWHYPGSNEAKGLFHDVMQW